jgi:hypothetical protein
MNEKRLKTLSLEKERVLRIPKEIFCQNRYASFLEEKVFEERGKLRKQFGERNFFQKVPLSMKKSFRCSGSLFFIGIVINKKSPWVVRAVRP